MTPEEKAKYLLEEMKGGCCRCPHASKEAALTCCNEIIQSLKQYGVLVDGEYPYWHEPDTEYWELVYKEIEKL